jgi:large subunit ribosomal protein L3
MSKINAPRKGSLQFWPRKRARKFLPRVNWGPINSDKILKGFICYKAGMASAHVKDSTPTSMTKDKKISVPVTFLECPPLKIYSVRFYKNGIVAGEVLSENIDKELKKKVKFPKHKHKKIEDFKDYDDVKILCYSLVKKTNIKKTPDLSEIGLGGNTEDKINFVKSNLGKEISVSDFATKGQLIDIRGLTTGRGLSGPVKRFGITLKAHKSEKGRRKPGSLGPWHPARTTFMAPQAGQLGMFTRPVYNIKVLDIKKASENPVNNLKNFGDIKTDYIIVRGSVQGPSKRQLVITNTLRATKKQLKKNYELLEIVR